MIMYIKRLLVLMLCILTGSTVLLAQATDATPNNVFTDNGKIGVVVAVLVTILVGLFIYLISLDKKITRLEKNKIQ
ncbi:MAG: CcmD family protein [Chitinophagia bacterium]|nr:CcmD family protein [Chitinophagia bacterium]